MWRCFQSGTFRSTAPSNVLLIIVYYLIRITCSLMLHFNHSVLLLCLLSAGRGLAWPSVHAGLWCNRHRPLHHTRQPSCPATSRGRGGCGSDARDSQLLSGRMPWSASSRGRPVSRKSLILSCNNCSHLIHEWACACGHSAWGVEDSLLKRWDFFCQSVHQALASVASYVALVSVIMMHTPCAMLWCCYAPLSRVGS